MKSKLPLLLFLLLLSFTGAWAQQKTVSGTVTTAEDGLPLPGVAVTVQGTTAGTQTGTDGTYTIAASEGQVLVFSLLGMQTVERTVGADAIINVSMRAGAESLQEVVVTALGVEQEKRSLGYAVTEVEGEDLAQTQRENFVNALQGRVAGLTVNNASGLPGSSSSVVIRGVKSLSGSNQPLFIVDGLPINNRTFHTGALVSDNSSGTGIFNRSVDFTNRVADINPEDIASVTVLKGPEAAALYGIEAANGAILITTKKGQAGEGRISYSNSFRIDKVREYPEIQQVYGQGVSGEPDETSLRYFGPRYEPGTQLYDNITGFFETAFTQKHNLAFDGGTERATYRISSSYTGQSGIVPNTSLEKLNLGLAASADVNEVLSADVGLYYTFSDNDQAFRGGGSPLLGLISWPSIDDVTNYLNPDGTRRRVVENGGEITVENPYFNVNKNVLTSKVNRLYSNAGITLTPTDWLQFDGKIGFDVYTDNIMIVRHAYSNYAQTRGGIIDVSTGVNRDINIQYYGTLKQDFGKFGGSLRIGSAVQDQRYEVNSGYGEGFYDPDFYSINNTDPARQRNETNLTRKRVVGVFGNLSLEYDDLLYLTLTGRNDWSSTLPKENNNFFYPSASLSFMFSELLGENSALSYGKLRASVAQVGKDAPPYRIAAALENAPTTGGGFRYGFTGPSPNLRPEQTTSYEIGTELRFFNDRLGVDAAYYRSNTIDQIVSDLRLSYGTGFILQVFNGGELWNEGIELQLTGTPVVNDNFSWDVIANFTTSRGELVSLPNDLPEYYVSDTWLAGNIRNGVIPGESLYNLTGFDYQRNDRGDILIDPDTGLPLRAGNIWTSVGDRNPDFTVGLTNYFSYKNLELSFLLDIRKGGDIYNGTAQYMFANGLSLQTLDREEPVVVEGVLKDGNENSANPTPNNIEVIPYENSDYYTAASGVGSEINFVERDINWLRLRDITLRYRLPASTLNRWGFIKSASLFLTATDVFILTNYTGLDPVNIGTSTAVGGSGGSGIDYGNYPTPIGINIGLSVDL